MKSTIENLRLLAAKTEKLNSVKFRSVDTWWFSYITNKTRGTVNGCGVVSYREEQCGVERWLLMRPVFDDSKSVSACENFIWEENGTGMVHYLAGTRPSDGVRILGLGAYGEGAERTLYGKLRHVDRSPKRPDIYSLVTHRRLVGHMLFAVHPAGGDEVWNSYPGARCEYSLTTAGTEHYDSATHTYVCPRCGIAPGTASALDIIKPEAFPTPGK